MNAKKQCIAAALILAPLVSFNAQAIPMEVEGPITSVVDNGNGTGTITAMGITFEIDTTVAVAGQQPVTVINSPTVSLSMAQLANPAALPGRRTPGFIGGTAIIIGDSEGPNGNIAFDVFVEPAENVVLGVLQSVSCGGAGHCDQTGDSVTVSGVTAYALTDSRIPAAPAIEGAGLTIDMNTALIGGLAALEGYYAGGALYYFAMEAELDPALQSRPGEGVSQNQVSVARARCRDGDEIRILGGVIDDDGNINGAIDVLEIGDQSDAVPVFDPATGVYTWSIRTDVGNCPETINVVYPGDANGTFGVEPETFTDATVDIR